MFTQYDRRGGHDRRLNHVMFERAFERRTNPDPRITRPNENGRFADNHVLIEDYWGASESDATSE